MIRRRPAEFPNGNGYRVEDGLRKVLACRVKRPSHVQSLPCKATSRTRPQRNESNNLRGSNTNSPQVFNLELTSSEKPVIRRGCRTVSMPVSVSRARFL